MRVGKSRVAILISFLIIGLIFAGCSKKDKEKVIKPPVEVKIDPWLVLGHDLKLHFSMPMVQTDESGATIFPEILFNPPLEGEFRWESPQELIFIPASGALERGDSYDIKIVKALPQAGEEQAIIETVVGRFVTRYFEMAGKLASWPIVKGSPRFVDYLGWHTGEIGRAPLYLLYDQPVEPKDVQGKIELYLGDAELPFELNKPAEDEIRVGYKVNAAHVIALKIGELPPPGEQLTLIIPGEEEESIDFVVNSHFLLTSENEYDWGEGRGRGGYYDYYGYEDEYGYGGAPEVEEEERLFNKRWYLSFSNYFEVEELKELLRVEPEPVSFDVFGYSYQDITIKVVAAPGAKHRVYLDGELKDYLGNPLALGKAGFDYNITAPDLPAIFRIAADPLTLEMERASLPLEILNMDDISAKIRHFEDVSQYIKALNKRGKSGSSYIREGLKGEEIGCSTELEEFAMNSESSGLIKLPKTTGFSLLQVKGTVRGSHAALMEHLWESYRLVHQTDISVTARINGGILSAWVTSIKDPRPLEGAKIRIYNHEGELLFDEGTTDSSGLVSLDNTELFDYHNYSSSPLYVAADYKGDTGLTRLVESELSSPWQFNLPGRSSAEEDPMGLGPARLAVFTDRGVYRPGESCRFKIIAAEYFKPGEIEPDDHVNLVIKDSRGREVVSEDLTVDSYGTASYEFNIDKQAPVGSYNAYISPYLNDPAPTKTHTFLVEEYRVPTFLVNVTGNQKEWSSEERIFTRVSARYLKGDTLAGRRVSWKVYRQRADFSVTGLPGFTFSGEEREESSTGLVTSGEGQLDSQGEMAIDFSLDGNGSGGMMRYIVQATVTDLDRQAYSGALSRVVHPGSYYVGIKPPSKKIISAGQILQIPYVTVDQSGKPVGGKDIMCVIERADYHSSVRMNGYGDSSSIDNRLEFEMVNMFGLKSGKTPQECSVPLDRAGVYRISFGANNPEESSAGSSFYVTVTGQEQIAWPRFDKDQIAIISDKDSYLDGEKVKLVVQSPYKNALALLTVERDGIYHQEVFQLKGDTPSLEFAIKADYAPNVYASVVLVRGREHYERDATGFETGAPGFKIGYLNIPVDPSEQRLTVKVAPDREQITPGQKMTVNLEALDSKGQPLKEGQATIYVVDEAVLSLTGYRTPDPLRQIYLDKPLDSRTASNLLDLPFARRNRYENLFPAGGEDGAGYLEPEKILRNLFQSTAYWNPNVTLDSEGKASVDIMMPDNITSYRIMAVVSDSSLRLGSADNKVVSKKPLMIQPVLPRFVYPGDRLEIEARVFNQAGFSGDVELTAEFSGLTLTYGEALSTKRIENGGSDFFPFKVKVASGEEVTVLFKAKLGEHVDLVEYKIPILIPGLDEKLVTNSLIEGGKEEELVIDMPDEFAEGTMEGEIVLSSTVLTELKESIGFIMGYPHGCIEQTSSTTMPLILLEDLLPEIGVDVNRDNLRKFSESGIERIQTFLTPSGGLSYWPGGYEPHAFGTGFGTMALLEAKKRGFEVPAATLNRLAGYMEKSLRQSSVSSSMKSYHDANGDTLALYTTVLGRLGRPQLGYIERLWQNRHSLSVFGLSFLAISAHEQGAGKAMVEQISGELKFRAGIKDDEASFSAEESSPWSFNSPVRSHAAALSAFSLTGVDDELAYKLLKGLLKKRYSNGLWGKTQSTVFGIIGFYDYSRAQKGGERPQKVELQLNNRKIALNELEKRGGRGYSLRLSESELTALKGGSKLKLKISNGASAPLNATLRLSYERALTGKNMAPRDEGFAVKRIYESAGGSEIDRESVRAGTLLRVRVQVSAEKELTYFALDDKLPAGLEPLNTNLKTTERVDREGLSELALSTMDLISYSEVRDSRVLFYVDKLPAGNYEFTYMARATTKGIFLRPAATAEAMYDVNQVGMSEIDYVKVR